MSARRRVCFVIMPFIPELHYFYLYLKHYLEQQHGILCERADAQVLTKPILDKIVDYIRNADVIIADISGRNPNVFYELGLAHAYDKSVILITKDAANEVPSDVRHFEFVPYDLARHVEFLERLDNALRNVFASRYEELFQRAIGVLADFRQGTGVQVEAATKEVFIARVMAAERTQELPSLQDEGRLAEFVLLRIITDSSDYRIVSGITSWLASR